MIEQLVKEFGEGYRSLIENSLEWLDENESKWHLEQPIDRHEYIANLVSQSRPREKALMTTTGYSRVGLRNV